MNIGGNIGMASVPNDPGIAVAIGSTGAAGGTAGLSGESPFQKMILKAMTNGGMESAGTEAAAETAATAGAGDAQQTDSISNILAGLLFGGINQTKLKLQTTDSSGSGGDDTIELLKDDAASSDLKEDSLEAMLEMFGGQFSASLVSDNGNAGTELSKTGLSAGDVATLIESAQAVGGSANRNGLEILNDQSAQAGTDLKLTQLLSENGGMTVTAELNGKTVEFTGFAKGSETAESAAANGANGIAVEADESGKGMTAAEVAALLTNSRKAQTISNDGNPEQVNTAQTSFMTDRPETVDQPEMTLYKTADGLQNQAVESEEKLPLGTDNSKDKPMTKTDGIYDNLKASAYQSQIQTPATTNSTAVDQLTQQVDTPEAYSQVADKIFTTLEQKGPTEFKMQLQPDNLGQIDISLKISEGKLIIDILADKSQTQALLTSQVDKLISSMGLQNVQVESVQVGQQMNSGSQNGQNHQGYQMNSGMDFSQGRQNSNQSGEIWQQVGTGIQGAQFELSAEEEADGIRQAGNGFGRLNYVV